MKASLFAIILSSLLVGLPAYAQSNDTPSQTSQKAIPKLDLNKADAKSLAKSIKGIGNKRAEAIVKYRTEQGKFNSVEDLAHVQGLGERFVKNHLSQLQEKFTVN